MGDQFIDKIDSENQELIDKIRYYRGTLSDFVNHIENYIKKTKYIQGYTEFVSESISLTDEEREWLENVRATYPEFLTKFKSLIVNRGFEEAKKKFEKEFINKDFLTFANSILMKKGMESISNLQEFGDVNKNVPILSIMYDEARKQPLRKEILSDLKILLKNHKHLKNITYESVFLRKFRESPVFYLRDLQYWTEIFDIEKISCTMPKYSSSRNVPWDSFLSSIHINSEYKVKEKGEDKDRGLKYIIDYTIDETYFEDEPITKEIMRNYDKKIRENLDKKYSNTDSHYASWNNFVTTDPFILKSFLIDLFDNLSVSNLENYVLDQMEEDYNKAILYKDFIPTDLWNNLPVHIRMAINKKLI